MMYLLRVQIFDTKNYICCYGVTTNSQDRLGVILILLRRGLEMYRLTGEQSLQYHIVASSVSPGNYLLTDLHDRQPVSASALVGNDPEADSQSALWMQQNMGGWSLLCELVRQSKYHRTKVRPFCISSTKAFGIDQQASTRKKDEDELIILSQCFRDASKPCLKRRLNSRNDGALSPPSTSIYSGGNLNGAASNPIFPGVLLRIKPKSICIRCPSRSSRIFPL